MEIIHGISLRTPDDFVKSGSVMIVGSGTGRHDNMCQSKNLLRPVPTRQ